MMGSPTPLSGLLHATTVPVMLTRRRSIRWASQSDVSNSRRPTSVAGVTGRSSQSRDIYKQTDQVLYSPKPLSFVNLIIEFQGGGLIADLPAGACSFRTHSKSVSETCERTDSDGKADLEHAGQLLLPSLLSLDRCRSRLWWRRRCLVGSLDDDLGSWLDSERGGSAL